jgi:hypothetical protein
MLLSYLRHDLAQVLLALRDQLLQQAFEPEKTASFLSAFPMFVPSLSWQNVRFYV